MSQEETKNIDPIFFEKVLIKFLFADAELRDKILPFLKPTIFDDPLNINIVKKVLFLYSKYEKFPTISEMKISLDDEKTFHRFFDEVLKIDTTEYNSEFLLDEIEEFFKKKMISNICADTTMALDGEVAKLNDVPDKFREVLSFGFNTTIGLDFFSESERLYNSLHNRDRVVSTGITNLDKMIEGGFHEKSLSLFLAASNVGKTLMMCSLATNAILQNRNVLYVTCEMSEEKISERILANILNIEMENLVALPKNVFIEKIVSFQNQIKNKLIIKEYPTKSVNANHLRNLLKDLKIKKAFVPDIMFIDYLGIMNSIHNRKTDNSYSEVKRISEEIRGLAVETKIPTVSALQGNRSSFGDSEIELDQVADSIGTVQTADLIIGISQSDEFKQMGKFSLIVLKNRYGINNRKITVNVDYYKMRVYEDEAAEVYKPAKLITNLPDSEKDKAEKVNDTVSKIKSIISNNDKLNKNKVIDFE